MKSKLWSGNHPLLCFTSVRSGPVVNHIWTTLRYEFVQNWPLNLGLLIHTFATKRGWGGMSPIASVSCTGRYLRNFSNRKVIRSNVGGQNLILDLWNHYLGFVKVQIWFVIFFFKQWKWRVYHDQYMTIMGSYYVVGVGHPIRIICLTKKHGLHGEIPNSEDTGDTMVWWHT